MKIKFLSAVCLLTAAAATLCGCNEGQTGGQHLNDTDTRIVEERGDLPGDDMTPMPSETLPAPAENGSAPAGDARGDKHRPPEHTKNPRRIFGGRRRCPRCPEHPDCPGEGDKDN